MSPAATRAAQNGELSLRAWAAELEAAAQIARQLAGTAFLPETHKRFHRGEHGELLDGKDNRAYRLDLDATTATAAAAILTGQELGLKPMASLRAIVVIKETPALLALTLRAVLQNAGHDIWVIESTATRAVVRARRAGDSEVQESTWTLDRARLLGLYPGKEYSNWRKQPQSMLVARATAEASRWISADALLGIPYIAEELIDELETGDAAPLAIEGAPAGPGQAGPNGEQPPAKAKRTAKRKTPETPPRLPTGPPLAGPAEPVPADAEPPGPKVSKPMLDKIHAGLRDVGVGDDRDKALTLISGWAGDRIDSTTKLSPDQAHAVLDGLEALRSVARRVEAETAHADAEAPQEPPPGDEPP